MTIKAVTRRSKHVKHVNERPINHRQPMTEAERRQSEAAFAALLRIKS